MLEIVRSYFRRRFPKDGKKCTHVTVRAHLTVNQLGKMQLADRYSLTRVYLINSHPISIPRAQSGSDYNELIEELARELAS